MRMTIWFNDLSLSIRIFFHDHTIRKNTLLWNSEADVARQQRAESRGRKLTDLITIREDSFYCSIRECNHFLTIRKVFLRLG
jgi:hypothetical protein